MIKLEIKNGKYTEQSLFFINAVKLRFGMTVGQAINFIEEETENGRDPLSKVDPEKAKIINTTAHEPSVLKESLRCSSVQDNS